jgi:hypothetical protein
MLRYQSNKIFLVKVSLQIGGFGEKIQSRSVKAIKYYMSKKPYFSWIYKPAGVFLTFQVF